MKKIVKQFWKRVISPTPKRYKSIRNFAGGIAVSLTAGIVAVNTISISLPEQWQKLAGIAIFVLSAIAAWAQNHDEKKPGKEEYNGK